MRKSLHCEPNMTGTCEVDGRQVYSGSIERAVAFWSLMVQGACASANRAAAEAGLLYKDHEDAVSYYAEPEPK